jgi:serine phosphatase RsbU (regulator of sigma subunit)
VLCALLDVPRHELTVANAGHLPPLVANGTGWHYVDTDVGLPVGVAASPDYGSVTVQLGPGATVLAFTDGLIERRGETLDTGLERLRQAIGATTGSLDSVISSVLDELTRDGPADDTAILGVRWQS